MRGSGARRAKRSARTRRFSSATRVRSAAFCAARSADRAARSAWRACFRARSAARNSSRDGLRSAVAGEGSRRSSAAADRLGCGTSGRLADPTGAFGEAAATAETAEAGALAVVDGVGCAAAVCGASAATFGAGAGAGSCRARGAGEAPAATATGGFAAAGATGFVALVWSGTLSSKGPEDAAGWEGATLAITARGAGPGSRAGCTTSR